MISKRPNSVKIPLVDLATQSRQIKEDVLRRMADVIDSARYILGKEVQEFEEQFLSLIHI